MQGLELLKILMQLDFLKDCSEMFVIFIVYLPGYLLSAVTAIALARRRQHKQVRLNASVSFRVLACAFVLSGISCAVAMVSFPEAAASRQAAFLVFAEKVFEFLLICTIYFFCRYHIEESLFYRIRLHVLMDAVDSCLKSRDYGKIEKMLVNIRSQIMQKERRPF